MPLMKIDARHARLLRLATRAALATALLLAATKALAWWASGSVSLLAGLTDSLLDGAASLVNLLAVNYALRPADEDHRFGHGKAESLAGLGQAAFIGVSALLVATQAIERLRMPQPVEATGLGIAVMLLSLLATAALLLLQRHVIRVTGSSAIQADALHYHSDLLLNGGILLALVLAHLGWPALDAVFGLGIALYILYSAARIAQGAGSVLMDRELPEETVQRIAELAQRPEGVLGIHDLRTRVSGGDWFVQLHLELPGELPLRRAHAICDEAEAAIQAEFPQAEVLVHADPRMEA